MLEDLEALVTVCDPVGGEIHWAVDWVIGWVTACGRECGSWPVTTPYGPTCPECSNIHYCNAAF